MANGTQDRAIPDPTEMWQQWYETASKAWSNVLGGQAPFADPYRIYRQWLKSVEDGREQKPPSTSPLDMRELWKQWFETTTDIWRKATELGLDPLGLSAQWTEMLENARASLLAKESFPADAFTFFRDWYEATSETWSTIVGDLIGREAFVESASNFLQSYTSFYRTFRSTSEEYLSNLQIPTRSDVARVAGLVVGLEDKLDRLEEAFEEFEYGYSRPATIASVEGLEERMTRVENTDVAALEDRLARLENKLDTVLAAVEKIEAGGRTSEGPTGTARGQAARRTTPRASTNIREVKGTGSAGEKARKLEG